MKLGCFVVVCALGLLTAGSQSLRASDSPTVFRAGVDLVPLNVVVTNGQNKPVNGLLSNNFVVFEDGVPQDVSFFAASQVPLDLAILLDASASMSDKFRAAQEAAVGFARRLRPSDRVSVIAIKDGAKVLHPLDGDIDGAVASINAAKTGGGTALYNSLYLSLRDMTKLRPENGEVRRQAMAVFTDGDDTASLVTYDDVLDVAKQAGIAIYTITLRSPIVPGFNDLFAKRSPMGSEFAMKELALVTGARSFFPTDIQQLAGVYGVIADELANQYILGYTPKNVRRDGAFRKISVRVDQPGTNTRTRSGYTAPRSSRVVALK